MPEDRPTQVPVAKLATQIAATPIVMGLLLFVPAGTIEWPQAWWFCAATAVAMTVAGVYLYRVNPEIIAARQKMGEGTKDWDIVMVSLSVLGIIAILPVSGLEMRFTGAALSMPVIMLGYLVAAVGLTITTWAQAANRHFEPGVRIQTDRGHEVIDTGPYALVRHPGYIAGSLLAFGMALALGSAWAIGPAAFAIVVLLVRTELEDRTLQAELPGYADYAARVRFRWLPRVW